MSGDITLPPLPHRALRPGAGDDAMTDYARAAILLDRQQRAAPRVHLPHVESALRAILAVAEGDSNPTICLIADTARIALRHTPTPPAPSAEPVDHTAVMRQALEALEERYIGALRDSALDALRAALGKK